MRTLTNLNPYTLLETSDIDKIYFYPEYAITNTTIKRKKDAICVLFEISKEKYTSVYKMNTYLYNEDNKQLFSSYSIYLKRTEPNRYVVISNRNEISHAEVLPKEIIDFNTLNYSSFINILQENAELSKMIPDLMNTIKNHMEFLQSEKKVAKTIDLPSPTNYYQNVTGYIIDKLENDITSDAEIEISKSILRNIKKNFEVVLFDEDELKLSYLSLYALILDRVKSNSLKPKEVLDSKELKLDTNKVSLSLTDLNKILDSFIESLKEEENPNFELNIIQERIAYAISAKPSLKEFKNYLKVILVEDKYLDTTKRNRLITEENLKNLVITSLSNQTYRPLPRNQVLIYNLIDNDIINFICVISKDKIYDILKSYHFNSIPENKKNISLLRTLSSIIEDKKVTPSSKTIELSILQILMMNIYYHKNSNQEVLLFNKGDYILKLDYFHGDYDIKAIDRYTEKQCAHLIKLSDETKQSIKLCLDKSEKAFISYINKLIYINLEACLKCLNIDFKYKEISHQGINIKFKRTLKKDILDINVSLEVFLKVFTSLKVSTPKKTKKLEPTPTEEPTELPNTKYGLEKEEYEFLIRKTLTICNIMKTTPVDNPSYQEIVKLYEDFESQEDYVSKKATIQKLKKLLETNEEIN